MDKKITRYLIVSITVVVALCVAIFTFLAYYLQVQNDETMDKVGEIYLEKVNERLEKHYETMIDYYFSRLQVLRDECAPTPGMTQEDLEKSITGSALPLGFSDVALLGADGEMQTVCGVPFETANMTYLMNSVLSDRPVAVIGHEANGDQAILISIQASYPMSNGERSVGIVGGILDSYFMDSLTLDPPHGLVSSYIIMANGSFILTKDTYGEDYYQQVRNQYGSVEPDAEEEIDAMETGLKEAIENRTPYSASLFSGSNTLHVYATPLPNSTWYLLTELPFGELNQAVDSLGSQWMHLVLGGCVVILVALSILFIGYLRLSREQMEQLREARAEAERANHAKSEFFSSMSHDIRTPMNAIVGMTAIAATNIDNREIVKNSLQKINLSSKQLLGLINDVLDMSKIESGQMHLTMDRMSLRDFTDSIVAIIQPQIQARRQRFDVYVESIQAETVYCDGVRLNQVLLNLLANAVKFTPEGGEIVLSIYEEDSPKGEGFVRLHIFVSDTGIGMSEEFQKVIYESFAREDTDHVRKTEGVGLGMAITKFIVDAMGGTIELKSAPGKGSQFHITLDLEVGEDPETPMVLPPWRILVVDDDRSVGENACAFLNEIGAQATWTLDGLTAIEMVREAQEKLVPYEIILIDWKLPFLNGIQTARRIRELMGDEVTILLISAYDWAEVEEEAREAGVQGFISKPLFKSTLFHGLTTCLQLPTETKKPEHKNDFTGNRVLVAEDNELNWEIIDVLLRSYGLELENAKDGAECVEKFTLSEPGYYDAILMDVQMPVMDGIQATQAIRELDRPDAKLPIIAMTADAFSVDVKKCLDAGMDAHVAKPIDIPEMLQVLTKYLR